MRDRTEIDGRLSVSGVVSVEWKEDYSAGYRVYCSNCGREAPVDRDSNEYIKMRVCPFCKASTEDEDG